MGKRGKSNHKINNKNPKRSRREGDVPAPEDMDDEIDAFHKQRDVIPLDMNGDVGESDEDNEHPVFDIEDEDEDFEDDDDTELTGLAAKIVRQKKFLQEKMGGVEDEMHDDDEEEEENKVLWGRKKDHYYNADEGESSDEIPAEEEAEVLRLQREKAKFLSMEDFGLEDGSEDEIDGDPTFEEILDRGKSTLKSSASGEAGMDTNPLYEELKTDIGALPREEQMDVVYSSAPELVGLLSELNDAVEQLERKVTPLLSKVKKEGDKVTGGIRYLEVKQLLLVAYCQAISFYLLLKSEGQEVRDHPVIARLVEIKSLLDKTKQLDSNLPPKLEEILNKNQETEAVMKQVKENAASGSCNKVHGSSMFAAESHELEPCVTAELVKMDSLKHIKKGGKQNHQNDPVGSQSKEMLKVRAALEEKLKKGIFSSLSQKFDGAQRHPKPVNGQLETYDDFGDDAMDVEGTNRENNGRTSSLKSSKHSQLVTAKPNKLKVISGDDDLPKRDDIGERRRKYELRVLAGAGINSEDDNGYELVTPADNSDAEMEEDSDKGESEDEFYEQVKQQRAAKLAAKAEIYSRDITVPSLPETVDGKRQITYQMEKNRGLTRARKKLIKNPRKKYKLKHKKAVVRRKGQVRDIKKPSGPYGGEASGINAGISRSVRFKN